MSIEKAFQAERPVQTFLLPYEETNYQREKSNVNQTTELRGAELHLYAGLVTLHLLFPSDFCKGKKLMIANS